MTVFGDCLKFSQKCLPLIPEARVREEGPLRGGSDRKMVENEQNVSKKRKKRTKPTRAARVWAPISTRPRTQGHELSDPQAPATGRHWPRRGTGTRPPGTKFEKTARVPANFGEVTSALLDFRHLQKYAKIYERHHSDDVNSTCHHPKAPKSCRTNREHIFRFVHFLLRRGDATSARQTKAWAGIGLPANFWPGQGRGLLTASTERAGAGDVTAEGAANLEPRTWARSDRREENLGAGKTADQRRERRRRGASGLRH